jgi:hypothetical protein
MICVLIEGAEYSSSATLITQQCTTSSPPRPFYSSKFIVRGQSIKFCLTRDGTIHFEGESRQKLPYVEDLVALFSAFLWMKVINGKAILLILHLLSYILAVKRIYL